MHLIRVGNQVLYFLLLFVSCYYVGAFCIFEFGSRFDFFLLFFAEIWLEFLIEGWNLCLHAHWFWQPLCFRLATRANARLGLQTLSYIAKLGSTRTMKVLEIICILKEIGIGILCERLWECVKITLLVVIYRKNHTVFASVSFQIENRMIFTVIKTIIQYFCHFQEKKSEIQF